MLNLKIKIVKTDNTEGVERLRIGNSGTIWKDENGKGKKGISRNGA
jgi:hypothetical protein